MGLVVDNVNDLPDTPPDGTEAIFVVGTTARESLFYNEALDTWIGKPKNSFTQVETHGMQGGLGLNVWGYPAAGEYSSFELGYGFKLHDIPDAGELWNSGLRLQEQWVGQLKRSNIASVQPTPALALTWYSLDDEEAFLSPETPNHGVRVGPRSDLPDDTFRYHNVATGWVDSPIPGFDTTKNGYPEIYLNGSMSFRRMVARHRWVYGAGVGAGDDTITHLPYSDRPPLNPYLIGWYDAKQIPHPDGTAIGDLTDWSSRLYHLKQSNSAKQPIVMSEGGKRFLRFDGVNDYLPQIKDQWSPPEARISLGQPLTIFMVMRERAGGGTTQVFFADNVSNVPLIYREGANDIHVWAQGSGDAIYTHAKPIGWTILSIELSGAGSAIWENKTQVWTGNIGSAGVGGIGLGNNAAEAYPATFDLAEFLIVFRDITTLEREEIVDWLNARNSVF